MRHALKTHAILKTFGSVYAHHCRCKASVKFTESRVAKSCRTTCYDTSDNAADGVTGTFHVKYQCFHLFSSFRIRATDIVWIYIIQVQFFISFIKSDITHLRRVSINIYSQLLQCLTSKSPRHNARNSFASGRATTPAVVTDAIFCGVSEICVRRAEKVTNIVIVAGMLVSISYYKTDRLPRSDTFKQSGENLHTVFFIASSHDSGLPGTTAIQLFLNFFQINGNTCRHTINHTAHSGTMRFTKSGDLKNISKRIHYAIKSARVALT